MSLWIGRHAMAGAVVLTLDGELDYTEADVFARTVQGLVDEGTHRSVELDMSRVSFVDSTGMAAVVACHTHASDRGTRLIVLQASAHVDRLLVTFGLKDVLAPPDPGHPPPQG